MTQVIAALDVENIAQETKLLKQLTGVIKFYKVGLQLFTAQGRRAVELVQKHGGKVFLDLKFLDIPQTVSNAVRETQKLGVDSISLHLSGGADMLRAAAEVSPRPQLWGVTVLTSLLDEDLSVFHPQARVPAAVKNMARLGKLNGIDATICSPREVAFLRKSLPRLKLKFVTPGIRPAGGAVHDQARVMTPPQASSLDIDYIVIGRPITHAPDPRQAALSILNSMKEAA